LYSYWCVMLKKKGTSIQGTHPYVYLEIW